MSGQEDLERGDPRQQQLLGHRLDRDDSHPPGGHALALRDAVDLGQDALDVLQVDTPTAVEAHPARAAG